MKESGRFSVEKLRKRLLLLKTKAVSAPEAEVKSFLRSFFSKKRPLSCTAFSITGQRLQALQKCEQLDGIIEITHHHLPQPALTAGEGWRDDNAIGDGAALLCQDVNYFEIESTALFWKIVQDSKQMLFRAYGIRGHSGDIEAQAVPARHPAGAGGSGRYRDFRC